MSDNEEIVAALHRERAGYVQRGLKDRVAEVDAELKRLGDKPAAKREERVADKPQETAVESRPRRTASSRGGKAAT